MLTLTQLEARDCPATLLAQHCGDHTHWSVYDARVVVATPNALIVDGVRYSAAGDYTVEVGGGVRLVGQPWRQSDGC